MAKVKKSNVKEKPETTKGAIPKVSKDKVDKKSQKEDVKPKSKNQDSSKNQTLKKQKIEEKESKKVVDTKAKKGDKGEKRKKDSKDPPADMVPPARRISGKTGPAEASPPSAPETPEVRKNLAPSLDAQSGIASPALSLSSIAAWKEEAKQKGMSLEEYMEEVSRQSMESSVDEHMKSLMA